MCHGALLCLWIPPDASELQKIPQNTEKSGKSAFSWFLWLFAKLSCLRGGWWMTQKSQKLQNPSKMSLNTSKLSYNHPRVTPGWREADICQDGSRHNLAKIQDYVTKIDYPPIGDRGATAYGWPRSRFPCRISVQDFRAGFPVEKNDSKVFGRISSTRKFFTAIFSESCLFSQYNLSGGGPMSKFPL